jgi:hypothetical protein
MLRAVCVLPDGAWTVFIAPFGGNSARGAAPWRHDGGGMEIAIDPVAGAALLPPAGRPDPLLVWTTR